MARVARMKKEIQRLTTSPPSNASCWPVGDSIDELQAQIIGGEGTPYENGIFKLEVKVPERYPFEPPKVRFLTKIYHPNVDPAGRICLDVLKMPPQGSWKPSHNISTLLTSIQLLMAEPNPDDPLMTDISNVFRYNKSEFEKTARAWTLQYARQNKSSGAAADNTGSETVTTAEKETGESTVIKEEKENLLGSEVGKRVSSSEDDGFKKAPLHKDSSAKRPKLMEDNQERVSESENSLLKRQALTKDNRKRLSESEDPLPKRRRLEKDSCEDDLFPDT